MSIIFRTDASKVIGTGHVMRCLALAQAWQEQGENLVFLMASSVPALDKRLISEGIEIINLSAELGSVEDAEKTIAVADKLAANWLVVDGYHFSEKYQKLLKDNRLKTLFFDDYIHSNYYHADLVLNQNIDADESLYINREPHTQLLLGNLYTLLRKEFLSWQNSTRTLPLVARKLLVTMGGSDPDNVTLKVIRALSLIKHNPLEVLIVVGGSNPHYEQLNLAVKSLDLSVKLVSNATNMPELMAWADLAIAAGGSTNWELAFMGLPTLVITIADNQREIAAKLHQAGIIINLGWHEQVTASQMAMAVEDLRCDRSRRAKMSGLGCKLVDGNGSRRVVAAMLESNS